MWGMNKIRPVRECQSGRLLVRGKIGKFVCQRWNTLSLKVTWRRIRMNIKNLSDSNFDNYYGLNTKETLQHNTFLNYYCSRYSRPNVLTDICPKLSGHWHLLDLVSFLYFLFLVMCARLSWPHSAFASTLNSSIISYRLWLATDH